MNEKELLEYGCLKFENCEYDEALEIFIWLYQNHYQQEWILDNIYNCYVDGNESTFRENFEKYKSCNDFLYEDCKLDFIPYKDGEYFIFDKQEKTFNGVISLNEVCNENVPEIFQIDEFSDVIIELDWDYRNFLKNMYGARERCIYVIAHDINKAISFFKIPEFTALFSNIKVFLNEDDYQKFMHENTGIYLPKIVFTEERKYKENLIKIFDEEHAYRLTDQGRNKDNILLTIGIPSHNRGNLILKRLEHLLPMKYDAEIEIVVEKNGTVLYQDEYKTASEIKDARYVYYGVNEELHPQINWHNVVTHASGKYVLFVSDEDDVVIESISHYLKLLRFNSQLSQVRAKTSSQYRHIKKNYAKKGLDAFEKAFLAQNYLSGLIVNRQMFIGADLLKYEKYWSNPFYQTYPHEWWCACLSQKGDYITEPVLLIEEKEPALEKEIESYEKLGLIKKNEAWDKNYGLPEYAQYERRFEQFCGQIDFVRLFMNENILGAKLGVGIAIDKLAVLIYITRTYGYKKEDYLQIINKFVETTNKAVLTFAFNDQQKKELLTRIKANECFLIYKSQELDNES